MVQHRSKLLAEQDNQVRNDLDLLDQRHTYQLPHLCNINVHVYCSITCTCMCSSTNTKKVDNVTVFIFFHFTQLLSSDFKSWLFQCVSTPCFTGHFPTYVYVCSFGKNHSNSWFVSCSNFSDYYSARITAWPQRYGTKLIGCTAHMETTYCEGS